MLGGIDIVVCTTIAPEILALAQVCQAAMALALSAVHTGDNEKDKKTIEDLKEQIKTLKVVEEKWSEFYKKLCDEYNTLLKTSQEVIKGFQSQEESMKEFLKKKIMEHTIQQTIDKGEIGQLQKESKEQKQELEEKTKSYTELQHKYELLLKDNEKLHSENFILNDQNTYLKNLVQKPTKSAKSSISHFSAGSQQMIHRMAAEEAKRTGQTIDEVIARYKQPQREDFEGQSIPFDVQSNKSMKENK